MQQTMTGFEKMLLRKGMRINKRLPIKIRDWKIFRGDQVLIRTGPSKGETGRVVACDKYKNRVVVEGVNLRRRLRNAKFVMAEDTIHYSNVNLLDPETGKPTRVKWRFLEDGEKIRISVKSGAMIPIPDQKEFDPPQKPFNDQKDTGLDLAMKDTYTAAKEAAAAAAQEEDEVVVAEEITSKS
eukprot:CAMPEP_0185270504 /NCGR_PEP_ID=MMETSP1359-20130426/42424_1 /TAXON_ID=552665 /ORGANISM="Bigelowiella longifila, Strain CCMP242" /LENGTH=182 /DNA_ID=CAMNT_0027862077 /DNA_START=21 /DNA_END=569 /DNA_ORIENTATION=-